MEEWRWVRRHGVRAWLTWATVEEACEIVPLTWHKRVLRKVL